MKQAAERYIPRSSMGQSKYGARIADAIGPLYRGLMYSQDSPDRRKQSNQDWLNFDCLMDGLKANNG